MTCTVSSGTLNSTIPYHAAAAAAAAAAARWFIVQIGSFVLVREKNRKWHPTLSIDLRIRRHWFVVVSHSWSRWSQVDGIKLHLLQREDLRMDWWYCKVCSISVHFKIVPVGLGLVLIDESRYVIRVFESTVLWQMDLHLQTQFGEDRCTQFRVIVVTDPQTHKPTNTHTGPITIHCAAKLSAV